jgi:hypothetical protein
MSGEIRVDRRAFEFAIIFGLPHAPLLSFHFVPQANAFLIWMLGQS